MSQSSNQDRERALAQLSLVREYATHRLNALPTVAALAATIVAFLVTANSIPKIVGVILMCVLIVLIPLSLWRQLHEVNEFAQKSQEILAKLIPEFHSLLESRRSVSWRTKLYLNSLEVFLVVFTLVCVIMIISLLWTATHVALPTP